MIDALLLISQADIDTVQMKGLRNRTDLRFALGKFLIHVSEWQLEILESESCNAIKECRGRAPLGSQMGGGDGGGLECRKRNVLLIIASSI